MFDNVLNNKIDFALVIEVKKANPNGDPLNGNRPRLTYDNLGEMSDVCLKRKIRNRLMHCGENVFVQSQEDAVDGFRSLSDRFNNFIKTNKDNVHDAVCQNWIDVRTFGQVFAFKNTEKEKGKGDSFQVRGPLSIQSAISKGEVMTSTIQITKSVNSETKEKKDSSTIGAKHRVDYGVYVTYGSINCHFAEKSGFSDEDAEKIKNALATLFENDCSSARPEGSMRVVKLIWWKHNNKTGQYPSAKVFDTLHVTCTAAPNEYPKSIKDFDIKIDTLDGLTPEIIEG